MLRSLLLILLLLPLSARADEAVDLLIDHQLLTAELQIARSGKLYILFDLRENLILFKAGGVDLRRLPLQKKKLYGPPPEARTRTLLRRETSSPPRREAVRIPDRATGNEEPKEEKNADDTLHALERGDMPGNYRLILDDGTRIDIRSAGTGFAAAVARLGETTAGAGRAVKKLFIDPSSELQLTLSLDDARQLYWSFAEEVPCLIRPPSTP
ncbi:hypothetical protein DSOUD_1144 [Desulfuromonas soudanensis]|uniref:Uncharacterized protein n=1 Tax=Desulfuromonas soudanensis TaxID=1603606 RepID=A0A0M4D1F6_9BACT|nr:hypothetical protein [Desulfuromonas soudanensis]ALC15926.1 hypothetical protein DSOUD_1144 [Desulfuromonas soudanensis]